jgi:hypothetical protein
MYRQPSSPTPSSSGASAFTWSRFATPHLPSLNQLPHQIQLPPISFHSGQAVGLLSMLVSISASYPHCTSHLPPRWAQVNQYMTPPDSAQRDPDQVNVFRPP